MNIHCKFIWSLLLVLFSGNLIAQNKVSVFPAKTGIVSYTLRDSFKENVPATLDKIKAMGLSNIEFSNLFGKTATEMKKLLDERNMICTSYGAGYADLENKMDEVVANASTLGAKYVRVAWIPHDAPFTIEDAKKTVEDFNKWGNALKDKGLTFCYHNHGYEFQPYNNETLYDYIIKNTNPEYVGFQMDILWIAHPGQDPVQFLKKYPDRFKLMHMKDLKKGIKGDLTGSTSNENNVPLGKGQLDIKGILQAAKNTTIEYYYIEDEHPEAEKQVPESIKFLQKLSKDK